MIGEVSVPNASDFFPRDMDVSAHVSRASLESAVRIRVSMGGDNCSNRHVR